MSTRKDYKHRSHGPAGSGAASGLMWLTTGLAIGLFVAFLVYLSATQQRTGSPMSRSASAPPGSGATTKSRPVAKNVVESAEVPRYDFYAILPEKEIEIPATDLADDRGGQRAQAKGPWMLQAGSFRNFGDADRLRANLAFKGLESVIDLSTNDAGTWHRVRLGPFHSRREADRIKSKLARSNIDSIILQVRR